jgi:hypothetical protein
MCYSYNNTQSVVITCTYDLWVFNNSIHQSKPRLQVTNTLDGNNNNNNNWQNSSFWAIAFLRIFCINCLFRRDLDHLVFTSLDFARVIFYAQPWIWRTMSLWDGSAVTCISPGTGFPFHLLLRLARIRWRYSNLPPHRTCSICDHPNDVS